MICSAILHLLIKMNVVQIVEEETIDPKTAEYIPKKMYPERFNPQSQKDWEALVDEEFPEDARKK